MEVTQSSHTLALVFTIAVVLSILIQAAVFVGLYIAVSTALKKITKLLDEVKVKAMPIIGSAQTIAGNVQNIVQDVTPKVKTVTSHVVEISATVRDQTKHVNSTVDDVVDKTKAQAAKVDDMVSAVLGSIAHAGASVQSGVSKPARRVSSILQGLQAGIESLFRRKAQNGNVHRGSTETSDTYGRSVVTEDEDYAAAGRAATVSGAVGQTIHPPPTTSSSL